MTADIADMSDMSDKADKVDMADKVKAVTKMALDEMPGVNPNQMHEAVQEVMKGIKVNHSNNITPKKQKKQEQIVSASN